MRILHISSSASLTGGAERCLLELIQYEISQGISPFVVFPKTGTFTNLLSSMKVPFFVVRSSPWRHHPAQNPIQSNLAFAVKGCINYVGELQVARIVRANHIDLIHINTSATSLGHIASKLTGVPHVWHIREFNNDTLTRTFYKDRYSRKCILKSDAVIAVSKAVSLEYPSKSPLAVIYDSIELPQHKRTRPPFSEATTQICLIANKLPDKGQIEAIKAMHLLPIKVLENTRLKLVGADMNKDYCREIERMIDEFELSSFVECLPFSESPYDILQNSDIALNCSKSESFGRTTVEAMASGCLVIGKDNTCTHELLCNGNGLLYTDEFDLARQIEWAISNRSLAREIAGSGYSFANSSFKDGSAQVIKLFSSVVNSSRNGHRSSSR